MYDLHVHCPTCGTVLEVPAEYTHSHARCGKCHTRFPMPKREAVVENTIADWLIGEEEPEKAPAAAENDLSLEEFARRRADAKRSERTSVLSAIRGDIRLVKLEKRSALFEFPTRRLREIEFRCAMPRLCLQCNSQAHLHAHVVIFTTQLVDSTSLEAEHSTGALKLTEDEVRNLKGEELLARLPHLPNVPPPADLPMPYWLCDMCGTSGAISGQSIGDPSKEDSRLRLLIRNLRGAAEFMAAAGGKDQPGYTELTECIEATKDVPWDQVPLSIQHRLQQWFKPKSGETFLAYIPDRDRVRTEDGMAGLLISSKRLIYQVKLRHRECAVDHPMEFRLAMGKEAGRLRIKTPGWEISHLTLDRNGIQHLRRSLTLGKFQANWV
jgi:hypothetical protein